MSRPPEEANRYLVTAFSITRGRWITDTTGNLELARMWADDWLRCRDRYSYVSMTDLFTRRALPVDRRDMPPAQDGRDVQFFSTRGGIKIMTVAKERRVVALGRRAIDLAYAEWLDIKMELGDRGIRDVACIPAAGIAGGWRLIDDPNLSAKPHAEGMLGEPECLRRMTGIQTRLAVLWQGKDWDDEPVLSAPVPYPSAFKVARLPGIGFVVVDPDRSEAMMPGMRCEDLGRIMLLRIRHALRNLPLGGFGEPITVVDDVTLAGGKAA